MFFQNAIFESCYSSIRNIANIINIDSFQLFFKSKIDVIWFYTFSIKTNNILIYIPNSSHKYIKYRLLYSCLVLLEWFYESNYCEFGTSGQLSFCSLENTGKSFCYACFWHILKQFNLILTFHTHWDHMLFLSKWGHQKAKESGVLQWKSSQ